MCLARPSAPLRAPAPGAPAPTPLSPAYKVDPVPHLKWARMLARVVRAEKRFRFSPGSAEEEELEEVAYLTLCRQALRYDASLRRADSTEADHFRGWSKRNILTECRRAAAKIRWRGLTKLPGDDAAKPRCATCTETVAALSADRRLSDVMSEEDGSEESDVEPHLVTIGNRLADC